MKPNIHVNDKVIYAARQPLQEEREANVLYKAYEEQDKLFKHDMVNATLEDRAFRSKIPSGDGWVCVSIEPGEELGQLSFNIQFEGRRGDYDFCLEEHNELLLHVSEWVKELLSELDSSLDFDVTIVAKPCPETDRRLKIDLAARVMEGRVTLEQARQGHTGQVQHPVGSVYIVSAQSEIKHST